MTSDASHDPDHGAKTGRRWPWLLLAAILLIAAGGGYWLLSRPGETTAQAQSPAAPLIQVATISEAPGIVLRQTGFVRATDAVEVVSQATERIVSIAPAFAVGNLVSQGEVLVRLDATAAEAGLASARARAAQAEAALAEARITLERQEELRSENVVSAAALEDAQVAFARAEADLAMAEADLSRAEQALDDTVIAAPFDAIVTREDASIGQFVQAGTSLGRLVATDSVEIEMGVLQSDLAPAGARATIVGQTVAIRDPATRRDLAEGRVAAILPEIDTRTRTVRLLVRVARPFDGDATTLRLGELVQLSLPLTVEDGPVLRVRAEALKGGDTLWLVSGGTLARRAVEVLSRDGEMVALRGDGLTAGDRVLLSDLAAPADGMAVRVADEDAMHLAEGG